MCVMLDSTAPNAAAESAQSDFAHVLQEFCTEKYCNQMAFSVQKSGAELYRRLDRLARSTRDLLNRVFWRATEALRPQPDGATSIWRSAPATDRHFFPARGFAAIARLRH